MNIVEKLLATDKGEFEKIGNARIISKQLSLIFGEGTEITIKAISGDEYNALSMSALSAGDPIKERKKPKSAEKKRDLCGFWVSTFRKGSGMVCC